MTCPRCHRPLRKRPRGSFIDAPECHGVEDLTCWMQYAAKLEDALYKAKRALHVATAKSGIIAGRIHRKRMREGT